MHIDDEALEHHLALLAQRDLGRLALRDALTEVIAAMPGLFGVDGAGLMLLDEQQVLRYIASTDTGAQALEAVQEATGRGPCVTAVIDDVVVAADDIAADDRWEGLGETLAASGIRAVLGHPIHLAGSPLGSVNVYHQAAHHWDDSDREALAAFERIAERLLAAAVLAERQEGLVGQLAHALESRVAIDRAIGVLMAVYDLPADVAFQRIRQAARSERRTAASVAAEVIASKHLP